MLSDAHDPRRVGLRHFVAIVLTVLTPTRALANERAQVAPEALKSLSIEELLNIPITTVERRTEPVGTTAAAISVITRDDLRRSGVTSIPAALRLATGVAVAEATTSTWGVSARGFTATAAGKMLVMIDDVPLNSALFRGTFWNTIDYAFEDIERIEVIRGPVALWGANAMNGIVNVITRHSADTRGFAATVSGGSEDRALVEARYGGMAGDKTWRAYGKVAGRDAQRFASGGPSDDSRVHGQAGFRLDGGVRDGSRWFVAADAFQSAENVFDEPEHEFTTVLLHGQGTRVLSPNSELGVQSYYRREYRKAPQSLIHTIDTVAVDAQHTIGWGGRHTLVWGGGTGANMERSEGTAAIAFEPADRTYALFDVFARNEFTIIPAQLFATAGAQVEHNAFSGASLQPSARIRAILPHNQMVWGSVTHASRRPTRLDVDLIIQGPEGSTLLRGDPHFSPETVLAAELGYRMRPISTVSFDATLFHHKYADLRSVEAPLQAGAPFVIGNSLEGTSQGIEMTVLVQPVAWWRAALDYTWLDLQLTRAPGSRNVLGIGGEANDPRHLFGLRTSVDLPYNLEADVMFRAVSALPDPIVPAYRELNGRLGWHTNTRVELFVIGNNLLHRQHPEFGAPLPNRVEIQRAVRGGLTVRF
jgi:iron complex outermembrane receptor protein